VTTARHTFAKALQRLFDPQRGNWVKGCCRLVQEHDFRFERDCTRNAQPLLLTAESHARPRGAVLHLVHMRASEARFTRRSIVESRERVEATRTGVAFRRSAAAVVHARTIALEPEVVL